MKRSLLIVGGLALASCTLSGCAASEQFWSDSALFLNELAAGVEQMVEEQQTLNPGGSSMCPKGKEWVVGPSGRSMCW